MGGHIYKTLKKHFNIEFAKLSSEPEQGWKDFENIKFSNYSAVIGFSLGGVYATCQNKIPSILLNPGYGLSKVFPEYKKLDTIWRNIDHSNILRIFISQNDKYSKGYLSEIKREKLEEKVEMLPIQKHVPTEDEIEKYLIPKIKELIGE